MLNCGASDAILTWYRPESPGRRALRRARHRWRDHGRGRGPRRRLAGPAHGTGRATRLRVRHVVEIVEDGARRAAVPEPARLPPRIRGAVRAPASAAQRAAPGEAAAVPH